MSRAWKILMVVGGYGAAVLAGWLAGYLYDERVSQEPFDTSGGMYAFGQMLASLSAFLAVALVPTLLAMWFLRTHEGSWRVLSWACLAFAGVGLLAILMPLVDRSRPDTFPRMFMSLLGLSQLLGVPFWTLAFALLAWLAPSPRTRRSMLGAVGLELGIGICAAIHWFVPQPPF